MAVKKTDERAAPTWDSANARLLAQPGDVVRLSDVFLARHVRVNDDLPAAGDAFPLGGRDVRVVRREVMEAWLDVEVL